MALLHFCPHTKQNHTHVTGTWLLSWKEHSPMALSIQIAFTANHCFPWLFTDTASHLHVRLFKEIRCLSCHLDLWNMSRWFRRTWGFKYWFIINLSISAYSKHAEVELGCTTWNLILQCDRKWKKKKPTNQNPWTKSPNTTPISNK